MGCTRSYSRLLITSRLTPQFFPKLPLRQPERLAHFFDSIGQMFPSFRVAFQNHIQNSGYIDLLWSDKLGYVLLPLNPETGEVSGLNQSPN